MSCFWLQGPVSAVNSQVLHLAFCWSMHASFSRRCVLPDEISNDTSSYKCKRRLMKHMTAGLIERGIHTCEMLWRQYDKPHEGSHAECLRHANFEARLKERSLLYRNALQVVIILRNNIDWFVNLP